MPLLLASSGKFVTKYLSEDSLLKEKKIAYITTAKNGVPLKDWMYIEEEKDRMNAANLNFKEIDLDESGIYKLRNILSDYEVIYVTGGNTFYLLNAVRASGFDVIIRDLLKENILYIGSSAGSYIMCPTIEMAGWSDSDVFSHFGVTDLTGINMVPFLIKAHYDNSKKEEILKHTRNCQYGVKVLSDEQAVFVDGDSFKIVGAGEEIVLV